jgi:hypothetical protein
MYRVHEPAAKPLTTDGWAANGDYLYGIDLFNAGYFWEAHVFWERLWSVEKIEPSIRLFLQTIIQTAAACLKARQGEIAGARKLLARAGLESIEMRQFGIDARALAGDVRRFVEESGEPPRILLSAAADVDRNGDAP